MPELITISTSRVTPPRGLLARMRHALGRAARSYWTGPFNLKDPALNKFFGVGARSIAGPLVNEHTIFTCSAFYDGVDQIASDVAKLPLNLHKRRKEGGSDHYTESKAYKLMKYSPNADTGSMVFRRQLLVHALVAKGGFAEIERDSLGRPAGLWNIEPHRVEPFDDVEMLPNGRTRQARLYRIDGRDVIDARDMIHIQGLSWDGVSGMEMVDVARQAIGLALASEHFAAAFFGNGTRFGGVLTKTDGDLDPDQAKQLREQIEALHAKADKAFRLLVLGAGFKYDASGVKPSEAQMKEVRDQQIAEVARFLNMPLHKLKLNTPGAVSYASVEMSDLDYYKGCLLNWITLCEEEFNRKLVPALEVGHQFFKHNANAFLRGTIKERYDALAVAHDRGVINADEWRALEDMNPQPDGQGKIYLVQGAMVPKGQLIELIDAKIQAEKKKGETPPPPPAPTEPGESDEVKAIRARLEAAMQLLNDAVQQASDHRAAYSAAHAAGEAAAAARAQELEQRFAAQAATHAEIVERVQTELLTVLAANDAVAARLVTETESRARAEAERDQARADLADARLAVESAQAARDEAQTAAADTRATLEAAQAAADHAVRDATAARAEVQRLERETADARAAVEESRRAAGATASDIELLRVRADAAETLAREGAARAEAHERAAAEAITMANDAQHAAEDAAAEQQRLEAALREAADRAASAEQRAVAAEADVQAQAQVTAAAEQRATDAEARAREQERAAADAQGRADDQHQALTRAQADQARLEADLQEANARASAAEQRARDLEAAAEASARRDVEAARAATESTTADANAARAQVLTLEHTIAEVREQLAAAQASLVDRESSHSVQAAALQASITEMEQALSAARASHATLERVVADAQQAQARAEATLRARHAAEVERMTATIAAHRGLIVDALGRMTRRECEQARSKQATAEKLRRWLGTFAVVHEAICIDALTPAIRTHLAWTRSSTDPVAVTTQIVREHIAMFTAQLRTVLESDPEDFHGILDRVLTRWESDRAGDVADALMQAEVAHLQALARGPDAVPADSAAAAVPQPVTPAKRRRVKKTIQRDEQNQIASIVEEDIDDERDG